MREIKFRAWDGSKYFRFDNHKYDLIFNDISGWNIAPNITGYKGEWTAGESQNKTPNFILEQFTGLYDKKGTEIYEGDILVDSDRKDWDLKNYVSYEVFYHDNDCCEYNIGFQMNRHHFHGSIAGTSDFRKFKPSTVLKMIVIGNIHQNPELL